MTHQRSYYLDDLWPPTGSVVVCKADILGEGFTSGQRYVVQPGLVLFNDKGNPITFSSARFQPLQEAPL